MDKIYDSRFLTIYYNASDGYFKHVWHELEKMGDEGFKENNLKIKELAQKYRPKALLIDSSQGEFTVNVELQQWHDREIVPVFPEIGLTKMAFIINPDFLTQISIEQLMEEEQVKENITTRFFQSEDKALDWLLEG